MDHVIEPRPDREYIAALVDYAPETGIFVWKKRLADSGHDKTRLRAWNTRYAGKQAGVLTHGYIRIRVRDVAYYAHHLAWLYVTGDWPHQLIDHINRDGSDNRFANLRLADKRLNAMNAKLRVDNTVGLRGVTPLNGRFMAQCALKGGGRYLGMFDTAEAAHAAYLEAVAARAARLALPTCAP